MSSFHLDHHPYHLAKPSENFLPQPTYPKQCHIFASKQTLNSHEHQTPMVMQQCCHILEGIAQ
eukprot:10408.XXX_455059_455247_1 [CDS] Oithona nana genome sequencing.